jgi:ribonuclease R
MALSSKKNRLPKKTSLRAEDPYLSREAERYGTPLPSREWVLEQIRKSSREINIDGLARKFSIKKSEYHLFCRRIHAMVRDGQVEIDRQGRIRAIKTKPPILCKVIAHRDGYGFAAPIEAQTTQSQSKKDWIIGDRDMRYLMQNDQILAQPLEKTYRGRHEVKVVEVVSRGQDHLLGEIVVENDGLTWLIPQDVRIKTRMLIDTSQSIPIKPGQIVTAKILSYPSSINRLSGVVVETIGMKNDSGIEIEIALRHHRLPHIFSDEIKQWVHKHIPSEIHPQDLEGRVDLRHLNWVTIDGETAKDFDDAVYAEPLPHQKGYRIWVAIADVSHYIKSGSILDIEAYERGTSVYFPRRVIPMLPEEISNGICSLNPKVDRLCMVCDFSINMEGDIQHYNFYSAVMHSKARLTYTQVNAWLNENAPYETSDAFLKEHLEHLHSAFKIMLTSRFQRGAVDFDTKETEIIFNEEGRIERIQPSTRNEAHRIIEECMLAANVCTADFLLQAEHASLFRVHEGPTPDKLHTLKTFLNGLGLTLSGGEKPHAQDYAKLAEQVRDRPDGELIHMALLRSMQQAVYQPENIGHFGLAYEHYTHFTSPIRRYPDLLVHRSIKAVLNHRTYKPIHSWEELGTHCSSTERRADDASRDVINYLKCVYMKDKVGEIYEGRISGVVGFGLFVTLNELLIEGLVHISDVGDDYFTFRPESHIIYGERTGKQFAMGDLVTVQVARVDLESTQIDFIWSK